MKMIWMALATAFCLALGARAESLGTATSDSASIDLSTGTQSYALPASAVSVEYGSLYGDVENGTAQFLVNGVVKASGGTASTFDWMPAAAGTYALEHRMVEDGEAVGTTLAVTHVVTADPSVPETLGSATSASAALDLTVGTVSYALPDAEAIPVEYGSLYGDVESGEAQFLVNGAVVASGGEAAMYDWKPATTGTYELVHRMLVGGVAMGTTHVVTYVATAEPPDWVPVKKGDTMVVYAAVLDRRAGSRLEAAGSLLAAFDANGECRGVVAIGEGPLGRLYSLSVGIESTSETGFVLKVWDATTGEIHVISETLYANDARQHGAIDDPIVYAFGTLDQIVTLEEGWTWISFALVPEDATVGTLLAGCTFGNGDVIMASDRVVTYYDGSWCPSSYELQPGVAYMVRKTAGGTEQMTVVGVPMSDGLSLDAGWNWFGPTVLATQKVTTVVHSGGFADHDQIKDASSVATQYGGTWYPSDFRLCAGVGYVAKLANSGTLWFGEPMASLSATTAKAALFSVPKLSLCTAAASKPSWKGVTKGNNMVVYADVRDLSTESGLSSDGSLLAAFDVAGECRGVATIEDGPCGRVFQLPVGLESTDETNFVLRIWNAKDATCYKIRERVAANGSRQLGQIFDPISFTTRTDPLPAISVPTQAEIGELLEQADDVKLVEKVTNETEYVAFREWSGKVQPHGGGNAVGAAGVMAAPNAWVSYALGSETLLEAAPTDADLTVEAFEPKSGEDGKFDFTVSVKDVDVGGAATTEAQKETMKENLKQVFGLEGGTSLEEGKMSSANVEIEFGTPVDGKVKFTAGPKDTGTKTFFMKVRVK